MRIYAWQGNKMPYKCKLTVISVWHLRWLVGNKTPNPERKHQQHQGRRGSTRAASPCLLGWHWDRTEELTRTLCTQSRVHSNRLDCQHQGTSRTQGRKKPLLTNPPTLCHALGKAFPCISYSGIIYFSLVQLKRWTMSTYWNYLTSSISKEET